MEVTPVHYIGCTCMAVIGNRLNKLWLRYWDSRFREARLCGGDGLFTWFQSAFLLEHC